jgi:hypothetical protein
MPPSAMLIAVRAEITAHERDMTTANNSAHASAITGEVADFRVTVTPSANTINRGG